jgi:outer membrane receptor protein involved in Fe transport
MGATVIIENSTMGAATDVNGEYIILNVPTGKHTLTVTYMGYQKVTVSDVIVNSGLTTFRDFDLPKIVLEGEEVVIVAERPLIDKSETNEIHYMRGEDIAQMPIRGVNAVITSMAGVVNDGGLHVRGGRNDEMAFYVDGVNVSNAFGGEMMTSIINNAIEEVQLQTGGFGAEYGGKMSGITVTTLKTGKPKYSFTGEVISDDFWAVEDDRGAYEILGINELYSFGYNTYTFTVGGPVIPSMKDLRFFVAAEAYNRMSNVSRFEGFYQDTIPAYGVWSDWHGTIHRDTLDLFMDIPPGRQPGGGVEGITINGNLVYDLKPVRIKLGGSWHRDKSSPQTTNPMNLIGINGNERKYFNWNYSAYLNVTHNVDPTMFYTLAASMTGRSWENGDPLNGWDGMDDWIQWGDPALNPSLLDTSQNYGGYYLPFDPHFQVPYETGENQYTINTWYNRGNERSYTFKFDLTKQIGKRHEVRGGAEYTYRQYRRFAFNALAYLRRLRDVNLDPDSYSDYDIYNPIWAGLGYDWEGEPVDEDMIVTTKLGQPQELEINLRNAPPTPQYMGGYLQDRIELRDLIINAGVRWDYFKMGHSGLTDLAALEMGPGGVVADTNWTDPKTYNYVSPRLGFSFPVTDRAVFHAQYGKYVQAPSLYQTWTYRSYNDFLEYLYGGVYFAPLHNPNLKPSKTTSYEFGLQMAFGANASLDVTAFYKDTRDLATYRTVIPTVTDYRTPTFYYNGDFGTIKGFTATFNLRRTSRIQATMNYTYSHAEGTGSTGGEHADIAWQEEDPQFPRIIAPLTYDQRHKGSVVVDVRSLPEDGPELFGMHPLGNVGLNMKFDFHSGSPFTRIPIGDAYSDIYNYNAPPPVEAYNSSTLPWFYQLDAKLDKTFNVGPVKLNVYLWAINLLDLKSITNGYRQTGRPDTDGWLETDAGKEKKASMGEYGETWEKWYLAELTGCGTWGWQGPRQIRFGLKFEI